MRFKCTAKGYVGLLVGAGAAAFYLLFVPAETPATGQEPAPPASVTPPTERIDVEQAVDFPYDI